MGAIRLVALLFVCVMSACAGVQRPSDPPAELRVIAEPAHATVLVNEQFVGSARVLEKRPYAMRPGKKRITIQASGHFPHDLELDLPPGVTTLKIKLRPVPP